MKQLFCIFLNFEFVVTNSLPKVYKDVHFWQGDAVDVPYIFKKIGGGGGNIQYFTTLCLVVFEKKFNFFSGISRCSIFSIIKENAGVVNCRFELKRNGRCCTAAFIVTKNGTEPAAAHSDPLQRT